MSKKQILVVALAVLALFGCTSLFPPEKTMASPDRPLVIIANGQVSRVDPDPLTFRPEQKNVVIIWELDEAALRAGFRFAPARGISIDRQVEGQPRDLAQECRPPELEVAQIIGVVDDAGGVGVL